MRLLQCDSGKFSLTNLHNDIPKYAILSHTWGLEEEEVTYKDLIDSTGEKKAGFEKLKFCAEQSARDGLQYFWIDTCCIDKSSSPELQEAITSMFRWYKNAARCYVYLSDVSVSQPATQSSRSWKILWKTLMKWKRKQKSQPQATSYTTQPPDISWVVTFRKSRWFTRGWTLQELLAPSSVEFFTKDAQRLGDKISLKQEIHEITGIAIAALEGNDLSGFDIEERFRWAERRQTKREEDAVYCLLGIFDTSMTVRYGNGRHKELLRLKKKLDKSNRAYGDQESMSIQTSRHFASLRAGE